MNQSNTSPIESTWRQAWRCLLTLLLIGLASLSWAGDHIVERAYLDDPSGNLTLEQAQSASQIWTPFNIIFTKGFTSSAIWFKFRIDPDSSLNAVQRQDPAARLATDDKLILRIRPAVLDQIELFDPLEPSTIPRISGDHSPRSSDEYQSLNYNFVIPRGIEPRTVWLRLKTTSISLFVSDALSVSELQASDRRGEFAYSTLLAVFMLFLTWGLMHWTIGKDRVVGAYVLKQLASIGLAFATAGYLRVFTSDWLPLNWIDQATNFSVLAYAATAVWFDYQILRDYQAPRWGMRLLLLALLLFPCSVALLWLGQVQVALRLNSGVYFFTPLLSLILALKSKPFTADIGMQAPVISKKVMVILFGSFVVTFSVPVLVITGVIQAANDLMYVAYLHGLITGVVMIVVLQVREKRMEARRRRALGDLALANLQAKQERLQRLEQSQFLSMLTHELKTPLSVIRLVLGAKTATPALVTQAESAVHDINNVIERCLQAGQLADGELHVQTTFVNLRDALGLLMRNCPTPERLHLTMQTDVTLQTDAKLLHIVLVNLQDNALKYSPANSSVDILIALDTRQTGAGVTISIQNTAGVAGWPDATMVFKKNYRNPRAHHQTGSGLGLYLVHNMAQMLGGELSYTPDELFIRFRLWLPL